jgi:hypothetical protein
VVVSAFVITDDPFPARIEDVSTVVIKDDPSGPLWVGRKNIGLRLPSPAHPPKRVRVPVAYVDDLRLPSPGGPRGIIGGLRHLLVVPGWLTRKGVLLVVGRLPRLGHREWAERT